MFTNIYFCMPLLLFDYLFVYLFIYRQRRAPPQLSAGRRVEPGAKWLGAFHKIHCPGIPVLECHNERRPIKRTLRRPCAAVLVDL